MNALDIVLIVLVALATLVAAKKGLLWSLMNFAVVILSGTLARLTAKPLSLLFYQQFLHQKISGELLRILPSGSVSGQISDGIESILSELPMPIISIAKRYGIYPDFSGGTQVLTVEGIEQDYIVPIVTGVLTIIATVLLFVIFSAILKIIAGSINHSLTDRQKHKFIGTTNTVLGAVLGAIKGVILVAVACVILNLFASAFSGSALAEQVQGSYLCGFIAGLFG